MKKPRGRTVTFQGETHNVQEWAKKVGVSASTLVYRLKHWGKAKALLIPPNTAIQISALMKGKCEE